MMCWHKWSKWSEPYDGKINFTWRGKGVDSIDATFQRRQCSKCNKWQTREVKSTWP